MKIGIIGIGPRGLSALERMIYHLSSIDLKTQVEILLFEESELLGYGHVYDIDQPDTNWINITERALENMRGRDSIEFMGTKIPSVPSYTESEFAITKRDSENYPDVFPRRSLIGKYLKSRFDSLIEALKITGIISIIPQRVINLNYQSENIFVTTEDNTVYTVEEALITIGHQPTEMDDQLKTWMKRTNSDGLPLLFESTYPITNITQNLDPSKHANIAIRGFGLATIDAIRALVDLYGGKFKTEKDNMEILSYTEGNRNLSIIPFSLNGLPAIPKPYNYKIDKSFQPSEKQIAKLKVDLENSIKLKSGNQLFLVDIMAKLISEMYLNYNVNSSLKLEEINIALVDWILNGATIKTMMTPDKMDVLNMMKLHVEMAEGKTAANLDYFAGQVWRHCQPTFYKVFSHSSLSDLVMTKIIQIDERIKRYSYGPPVASMKQLILLAEAGTLDLCFVNDPNIDLTKKGWLLSKNDDEISVTCMINSIIDSPQILKITSSIIKNLLAHEVIQPVHHEFGLDTKADGQIITPDAGPRFPIYILGRIAKGSVIGVDAILECFGDRIDKWAEGLAERYSRKNIEKIT